MKKLLTSLSIILLAPTWVAAETVVMDPAKVDAENAKRRMAEQKAKNSGVPVQVVEPGQLGKEEKAMDKVQPKATKERRPSRWSRRQEHPATANVQTRTSNVRRVDKVPAASKQQVTKTMSGTKETWKY